MRVARSISETRAFVRSARSSGRSVGLVPTMGAFHDGHLALMKRARHDEDVVVVSIFVNPTQFGPGEDFQSYPRDFDKDARLAEGEGVDLIFAPTVEEMYPTECLTSVRVSGISETLCGPHRPGHFEGVATVCTKLFNIVQPDRAFFGQKDYQQLQVIRKMVEDLNQPTSIVGVPTVREPDGLAMSSRNQYLSGQDRSIAPALRQALQAGAEVAKAGATGAQAEAATLEVLSNRPQFRPQYVSAVHPETLAPTDGLPMVIAAAAYLGKTRLIDNILVDGS